MTTISREVSAGPDAVFAVLADGWSYAAWVVGNSHVRSVDPDWPAQGSRIHHSAGFWPLQLNDTTEVVDVDPGRRLELNARFWPLGRAVILLELAPAAGGGTRITMTERFESGPIGLVPGQAQAAMLTPRNRESLSRLGDLAAGRERATTP
jgi:uncharacterized protein YndB with AHSA1/START domain